MPLGANKAVLIGAAGPQGPFEASGGTESTSGSYTIHTFLTSSALTVTGGETKAFDYLILAGGAGGGNIGGGGAGGDNSAAAGTAGTANTGVGGGGGGYINGDGAAGGSGIVIISYTRLVPGSSSM